VTPRQTGWLRRTTTLALGGAVLLLLSGCVYLRLLALKRQIAAFDQHFALETTDGLLLIAREPVVLSGDVRWLGIPPEMSSRHGNTEEWRVRWTKRLPPGSRETADYDLEIALTFTDDKLSSLRIPERYFGQLSKPFLVEMLRSLGGASVNKKKRALEASVGGPDEKPPDGRPTLRTVHDLLGVPTEQRRRGQHQYLRYRYTPVAGRAADKAGLFDVVLTFDTTSGELQSIQGRTPVGRLAFTFATAAAPQPPL